MGAGLLYVASCTWLTPMYGFWGVSHAVSHVALNLQGWMMEADSMFGGGWGGPLPRLRADNRAGNGVPAVARASPTFRGLVIGPSSCRPQTPRKDPALSTPQLPVVSWASILVRSVELINPHSVFLAGSLDADPEVPLSGAS